MVSAKKKSAPKRKAAATPKKPQEVSAVKKVAVAAPKKATAVSAVRAAMTDLMVKHPDITTDELSAKLAQAGHKALTTATLRTMSYHCGATLKALAAAGLLNVSSE